MDLVDIEKVALPAITAVCTLVTTIIAKEASVPKKGQKAAIQRLYKITLASLAFAVITAGSLAYIEWNAEPPGERMARSIRKDLLKCVIKIEEAIKGSQIWAPGSGANRESQLADIENIRKNFLESTDACSALAYKTYEVLSGANDFNAVLKDCAEARKLLPLLTRDGIGVQSLDVLRDDILAKLKDLREKLAKDAEAAKP